MAVSGEVALDHDGGVKLHPYLIALARWCVSCVWSTATAMLYRLLANPLPQLTVPKPSKARPAGKEHLHPEPKVECVVLHQPSTPRVDVIFVHGLYGSLGNTWRQGEWKSKYKIEPNKISLRRPSSIPTCDCSKQIDSNTEHINDNNDEHANCKEDSVDIEEEYIDNNEEAKYRIKLDNENILNFNDKEITFTNIDEYYKKRITDDEVFITEKFYKDVDQCEVIDNYETQAKFVRDLFASENLKEKKSEVDVACRCRMDAKQCEVGCGCVCDECYSSCWPRDWIKMDYPDARVISVNYTSDPHLWRPLWIKESKRLHLHERAEQMIEQLLSLGVGERPIVWVGHSKGGLFIKQIYCEAYEAYIKLNGHKDEQNQHCYEYAKDNEMNHKNDSVDMTDVMIDSRNRSDYKQFIDGGNTEIYEQIYDENFLNYDESKINDNNFKNIFSADCRNCNIYGDMEGELSSASEKEADISICSMSSNEEEELPRRAALWRCSGGFMFYSVPHRGSPLADIKTPITARSVELLEMGQDCSLARAQPGGDVAHAHGRAVAAHRQRRLRRCRHRSPVRGLRRPPGDLQALQSPLHPVHRADSAHSRRARQMSPVKQTDFNH